MLRDTARASMLIVNFATGWYSAASSARLFSKAGYRVTAFCGAGTLLSRSRFASRVISVEGDVGDLLDALRLHLASNSYDRVYIGDDVVWQRLAAHADELWIRQWLCVDPQAEGVLAFLTSKHGFLAHASRAGIPVAPFHLIIEIEDARRFVADVGYPIVAKTAYGSGGSAISVVGDDQELVELLAPPGAPRIALQRYVSGRVASIEVLYHHGEVTCFYNCYLENCFPTAFGQSSRKAIFSSDALLDIARRVGAFTQFHGPASIDTIIEDGTGNVCVLEVNPRLSGGNFGLSRQIMEKYRKHERSSFAGAPASSQDIGIAHPPVDMFPQTLVYAIHKWQWTKFATWRSLVASFRQAPWDDPGLVLAALYEPALLFGHVTIGRTTAWRTVKKFFRESMPGPRKRVRRSTR